MLSSRVMADTTVPPGCAGGKAESARIGATEREWVRKRHRAMARESARLNGIRSVQPTGAVFKDRARTSEWTSEFGGQAATFLLFRMAEATSPGVAPRAKSARNNRSADTVGSAASTLAMRDWLDFSRLASSA